MAVGGRALGLRPGSLTAYACWGCMLTPTCLPDRGVLAVGLKDVASVCCPHPVSVAIDADQSFFLLYMQNRGVRRVGTESGTDCWKVRFRGVWRVRSHRH